MLVHEWGHVLAAWATGGQVQRVVLGLGTLFHTDLQANPQPLLVAWAGPVFGSLIGLPFWIWWRWRGWLGWPIWQVFAAFCLVANGSYLACGSLMAQPWALDDPSVLLRHGASTWMLWLFGLLTVPGGYWLGREVVGHIGLGNQKDHPVSPAVAVGTATACAAVTLFCWLFDGA